MQMRDFTWHRKNAQQHAMQSDKNPFLSPFVVILEQLGKISGGKLDIFKLLDNEIYVAHAPSASLHHSYLTVLFID